MTGESMAAKHGPPIALALWLVVASWWCHQVHANPVLSDDMIERLIKEQGNVMPPNQFFAMAFDDKNEEQQPRAGPSASINAASNVDGHVLNPYSSSSQSLDETSFHQHLPTSQYGAAPSHNGHRCKLRSSRYLRGPNPAGFFGPGISITKEAATFKGQLNTQILPRIINKYS